MLLLLVLVSIFSTGLSMPGGWSEVNDDALKTEFLGILTETEGNLFTLGLDYNVTKIESQVGVLFIFLTLYHDQAFIYK